MFLLIAIIFIAEMIIALTLINYIVKADKAVIKLKADVSYLIPQIKAGLDGLKEAVHIIKEKQLWFFEYLEKKRNQYIINAIKTILMYLLLFLLKGKSKKAVSICNGIILVKELWDSALA